MERPREETSRGRSCFPRHPLTPVAASVLHLGLMSEQANGKTLRVRLTGERFDAYAAKAKAAGKTLSRWIRDLADKAAPPAAKT